MTDLVSEIVGGWPRTRRPTAPYLVPEQCRLRGLKAVLIRICSIVMHLIDRLQFHVFGASKSLPLSALPQNILRHRIDLVPQNAASTLLLYREF